MNNLTKKVKENFDKTGFAAYGVRHRYNEKTRLYITQYPNMSSYALCAEKRVEARLEHDCGSSSRAIHGDSWDFGAGSVSKAAEIVKRGYVDGAKKLRELAAVAAPVSGFSYDIQYDVAGDEPDIDRYLSGDPDNMVSRAPKAETRSKVIRLYMPWTVNYKWKAREFENRGAAMLTIVQALDAAGYAVELSTGGAIRTPNCSLTDFRVEKIIIKAAEDHFNAERIAASLAHPAPFRRMGLAIMELDPNVAPETLEAYGYPQLTHGFREAMQQDPVLADTYIIADDNRSSYSTIDRAIKAIKASINYDDLMLMED